MPERVVQALHRGPHVGRGPCSPFRKHAGQRVLDSARQRTRADLLRAALRPIAAHSFPHGGALIRRLAHASQLVRDVTGVRKVHTAASRHGPQAAVPCHRLHSPEAPRRLRAMAPDDRGATRDRFASEVPRLEQPLGRPPRRRLAPWRVDPVHVGAPGRPRPVLGAHTSAVPLGVRRRLSASSTLRGRAVASQQPGDSHQRRCAEPHLPGRPSL